MRSTHLSVFFFGGGGAPREDTVTWQVLSPRGLLSSGRVMPFVRDDVVTLPRVPSAETWYRLISRELAVYADACCDPIDTSTLTW